MSFSHIKIAQHRGYPIYLGEATVYAMVAGTTIEGRDIARLRHRIDEHLEHMGNRRHLEGRVSLRPPGFSC